MRYAQLGTSDLNVSRICFGCWQLSPKFWGDVPIEPWQAALDKALELGINFIDTAGAYGDGYAETCLRKYFKSRKNRDKFIVATKVYWNFGGEERHPETTYRFIVRQCEDALKRLKTDCIDLWQIHAWDPLTRPEEVASAMWRLKREGMIRHAGVSNLNVEQMALYRDCMPLVSLQPPYNLVEREIESRELPYCLHHNIGVLPYSPLHRGLLTGKYAKSHQFTDSRAQLPLYQGEAFARMLDALQEVAALAEAEDLTMPQMAIRWVLTHPAVTSAIVGFKTPEQVESMAPAAEGKLSIPLWHKVASIIDAAKKSALGAG